MTDRFTGLEKIPNEPAMRMLAMANVALDTQLSSPANATVETVMEELDSVGAIVDQIRLMAVALPPRERVWWACLAAQDMVGDGEKTAPLLTAEAWVRKPSPENRHACDVAVNQASPKDQTVNCGFAVVYSDGTIGEGERAAIDAPPGGSAISAMVMNADAMGMREDDAMDYAAMLIDRAVDIARGGDGRVEIKTGTAASE